MVQIKLSVAFVLAAAAIAPVIAQPISVEHANSSKTGVDAHVIAKAAERSKVVSVEPKINVGSGHPHLSSHLVLKDLLSRLHLDNKFYGEHNLNEGLKLPTTRVAAHIHLPRDNSEMVERSFDDFDLEARYATHIRNTDFRGGQHRGGSKRKGPKRGGRDEDPAAHHFAPGAPPISQRVRFGRTVAIHRDGQPFPTTA